ncbi:MAG: tRNA (guanosine(37)-N1)-methyltransferase TrmD, partial [Firmicutes bacterium]|nr:tRNA (guanosine(37)-N1)-methyltransferase TrmD [Bacillota bacterium]
EYPQYTKPRSYEGLDVPEVLTNGNHKLIHLWQFEQSLRLTKKNRPDLFAEYVATHNNLTKDEKKVLDAVLSLED